MQTSTRKVEVAHLRVGMFVSKLDRDWLETPFLLQGFLIEEEDDIDTIAEYCQFVYVDVDKSIKEKQTGSSVDAKATFVKPRIDPYEYQAPLEEEQRRVMGTFRQARSLTKSMLDDIRLGGAIDTAQAKSTVNECVQSVIRHPDALLWMSKMREENEYTAEHCLNVCILAVAFGRQLGFGEEDLLNLGLCGLLHDVGKMKVPPAVLDKPGPLTEKEMRIMMAHTVHGRNLLMSTTGIFSGVVDVAFSHHERMDGKGYPRKLPGHGMSKFSRIIAIVDAYDAMTADRCYQSARTSTEAMKILYRERGTHFDEHLTLKFLQSVGLYPAGSIVELGTSEVGIVVESNPKYRQLPKVLILTDNDKNVVDEARAIDLADIERGQLSRDHLIKKVWKDKSFGISVREYQEKGLITWPS